MNPSRRRKIMGEAKRRGWSWCAYRVGIFGDSWQAGFETFLRDKMVSVIARTRSTATEAALLAAERLLREEAK